MYCTVIIVDKTLQLIGSQNKIVNLHFKNVNTKLVTGNVSLYIAWYTLYNHNHEGEVDM